MLHFRRTLGTLCYLMMLIADAASVYIIYMSVNGSITYHLGMLLFVPVFILSYWFSTFFMQLTEGRIHGRRIMPKWLRGFLNFIGTLISLALVVFWGYIFVVQQLNRPVNDGLVAQSVKLFI